MNFGEKLRQLRENKKMTQKELADELQVSLRTISSYETKNIRPRYRKVYDKLADIFDVNVNYLLTDEDDFILNAREKYGYSGYKDANELVEGIVGLFAGGELDDDDKKAVLETIQEAYYVSKMKNKKYSSKNKSSQYEK